LLVAQSVEPLRAMHEIRQVCPSLANQHLLLIGLSQSSITHGQSS
jgi:hypothetical protein